MATGAVGVVSYKATDGQFRFRATGPTPGATKTSGSIVDINTSPIPQVAGETATVEAVPINTPNRISHLNLFPEDAYTPVQRFELREVNGRWKTVDAQGNAFTARGGCHYVVIGDKIYATKAPSQPAMGQGIAGHIDIARGADVGYAGEIRFGSGRRNRGVLQWWDNSSGHYRPKASDAGPISDLLPTGQFRGR